MRMVLIHNHPVLDFVEFEEFGLQHEARAALTWAKHHHHHECG